MSRTISLVQRVQIASPCTASWDDMRGDHRMRRCDLCQLNVYNLSAMTQDEGERLIRESEGRLCARLYRRADGTILTRDCPVGWAAIKRRVRWVSARAAAALLLIAAAATSAIAGLGRARPELAPFVQFRMTMSRWLADQQTAVTGRMLMGDVCLPPPPASTSPDQ